MRSAFLQTMVVCFVSTNILADETTNPFRAHATAQTAAFMISRDPKSQVTVQVIQCPLSKTGQWGRENISEKLVHYQIIVRDASGTIIPSENYGWFNANGMGITSPTTGKISMDQDLANYDSEPVAEIKTTWGEHYEARENWERYMRSQAAYSINPLLQGQPSLLSDEQLKMTRQSIAWHCQNAAWIAFTMERQRKGAIVIKEFHYPGEVVEEERSQVENSGNQAGNVSRRHPYPGPGPIPPQPDPEPQEDPQDIFDSIEEFGETLEDIVDERRDMREDRAERKAKERAERERQAAEEAERIRQQQIADQRRNDERKKTEKKTSETKSTSKPTTTQKQTSSGTTASIDFSKLNSLVSQQVSLVRGILSSGKKATSAQHAKFNSLNNQYVSEFNRLKAQIAKVSDPAKRSAYYSQLATVNRRINSELDPLLAQGQSRGLFVNL